MGYVPSQRIREMPAVARGRYAAAPDSLKVARLAEAFFDLHADAPLWERQARAYAHALVNEPVVIIPGDLIQGMIHRKGAGSVDPFCGYGPNSNFAEWNARGSTRRRIERELPAILPYFATRHGNGQVDTFIINEGGTPGHIAWRWDWVLRQGLEAIIASHRRAAELAEDAAVAGYYQGVAISLEAILEWNRRHVAAIRRLLADGTCPPEHREALAESAEIMARVPAQPARGFYEALQAYHLLWLCAFYDGPYGGNSPGRFDFLLWPFLKDEYEAGRMSGQEATDLVAEVFVKCDEMVCGQDTSVLTIVTGGLDGELRDAVNPLSLMVIDAIEALSITHPAVYNRISVKNPPEYRQRCLRYMLRGGNRAQFLNEEAILAALTADGRMSAADAAMYICGGCMEINPQGLTADLFWSFHYNIGKTLELCLTGGLDLVDGTRRLALQESLLDQPDFDSFYQYVVGEVEKLLTLKFRELDVAAGEMARLRPQFVISSLVEDCFARGRGQMDGGARYADYGGSVIGMPNVANSLMAVKKAVFDDPFVSASELLAALRDNFAGREPLRRRLRQLPKYGEMNAEADGIMNRLLGDVSRVFDAYTTVHGGKCKQVLLTFNFAPALGAALGATAEGNVAGTPVAHGLTPSNTKEGLSAAMGSYLSLDNQRVTGGASTMWDMDAESINEDLLDSIYRVFEVGGGQIFQGNMTDVAELERAFENPESHADLIVRVGGFSARFVGLDREVQREVINRRRWRG